MIRCTNCRQSRNFVLQDGDNALEFQFNEVNKLIESATDTKDGVQVALDEEQREALLAKLQDSVDEKVHCGKCDEEMEISDAKMAYEDSSRFFEEENLCHCGGEMWFDQIQGTATYGLVCDDCGWVRPKSGVRGD